MGSQSGTSPGSARSSPQRSGPQQIQLLMKAFLPYALCPRLGARTIQHIPAPLHTALEQGDRLEALYSVAMATGFRQREAFRL